MKIIILAGFLGSGKTSLLLPLAKKMISQSSQVAIIENEIGEIGIDGSYLKQQGLQVQELFGGCICCTLTVGLIETVTQLQQQYKPDTILIESTGMARPGDLKNTLQQYASHIPTLSEIEIITVVDAERYELLRNGLAPLFEAQIEAANLLLINKIDLVAKDQCDFLLKDIKQINSSAQLLTIVLKNENQQNNDQIDRVLKIIT
jgi:G3E family GTPase